MSDLWTASALIEAIGGRPLGQMPAGIGGISIDTRTLKPGDAFFAISGIDAEQTTSSAIDDLAQFVVVFQFEKDLQQASQDIRDAISSKRADLPQEMEEPILTRFDPADMPIISLTLRPP